VEIAKNQNTPSMTNITLFSQITRLLNRAVFNKLVSEYSTDKHNKGFNSWSHLISMLFSHFSNSQSLRDISNGLRSATGNLSHLGNVQAPSKSNLSYQNKHRDWRLFRDYYYKLYEYLGQQAKFSKKKLKIKSRIFLLDSTTITLSLSLFDWAKYKTRKGAIKLHTLLDYDGNLPAFILLSDGKKSDNDAAYDIPLLKNSVIVADRYYVDFALLNIWDSSEIFFVVRHKSNLKYKQVKEKELPKKRLQNILIDEIIELTGINTKKKYPKSLRRIAVYDEKNNQVIELLTNNKHWSAGTIAELYKSRWRIEIFFREIKQLLNIKSFIGTSVNAVLIQIWSAMIVILLLKYLKAISKFNWHLSNLVVFIRINLFVKIDLYQWLNNPIRKTYKPPGLKVRGLF
jgi:hypothetical protein